MSKHIDLSPESLPLFVPDVYQKSILDIDYSHLKEKGIEVISFDIDDTIGALEKNYLRYFVGTFGLKKSRAKFEELRQMGLLTGNISVCNFRCCFVFENAYV